jgi:hypothetical protein
LSKRQTAKPCQMMQQELPIMKKNTQFYIEINFYKTWHNVCLTNSNQFDHAGQEILKWL